jgi:hypothetical protein
VASLLLLTLPDGLELSGRVTLVVFLGAVALWVASRIDDTFVALGAALALVTTGVVGSDVLFATLGAETIWLLIAAFVLAAGKQRSRVIPYRGPDEEALTIGSHASHVGVRRSSCNRSTEGRQSWKTDPAHGNELLSEQVRSAPPSQ